MINEKRTSPLYSEMRRLLMYLILKMLAKGLMKFYIQGDVRIKSQFATLKSLARLAG